MVVAATGKESDGCGSDRKQRAAQTMLVGPMKLKWLKWRMQGRGGGEDRARRGLGLAMGRPGRVAAVAGSGFRGEAGPGGGRRGYAAGRSWREGRYCGRCLEGRSGGATTGGGGERDDRGRRHTRVFVPREGSCASRLGAIQ
jgi:hypothetical protein